MSVTNTADAILRALGKQGKQEKPEGATTIYKVRWHVACDSLDGSYGRVSSSPTPTRLERSKTFVSKYKADELKEKLQNAFKTLDYLLVGRVWIEEDWFE